MGARVIVIVIVIAIVVVTGVAPIPIDMPVIILSQFVLSSPFTPELSTHWFAHYSSSHHLITTSVSISAGSCSSTDSGTRCSSISTSLTFCYLSHPLSLHLKHFFLVDVDKDITIDVDKNIEEVDTSVNT